MQVILRESRDGWIGIYHSSINREMCKGDLIEYGCKIAENVTESTKNLENRGSTRSDKLSTV